MQPVDMSAVQQWEKHQNTWHCKSLSITCPHCGIPGNFTCQPLSHCHPPSHDRVDIYLDIDRDHVTYYHLAIDYRGWPAEDCWGDKTWNPVWFVAAATDEGTWRAEAAIPLDQLTGRFPLPGEAWSIGIQRTVPGVGFQSWNKPATIQVSPAGFGYMIFN